MRKLRLNEAKQPVQVSTANKIIWNLSPKPVFLTNILILNLFKKQNTYLFDTLNTFQFFNSFIFIKYIL